MGTTPPITTNNPQNTRSTKPDQATVIFGSGGDGGMEAVVRQMNFVYDIRYE